jgi:hypothetical protein
MPSRTAASANRRRLWFAFFAAAASRRSAPAEKSVRNLTADAIVRILPAPWNHLSRESGIPHESNIEAAGINSKVLKLKFELQWLPSTPDLHFESKDKPHFDVRRIPIGRA